MDIFKKNDKTKYLALFHSDEKYERIFDRIRYLKSNISDIYSHKTFGKNIKYAKCSNIYFMFFSIKIIIIIITKCF